MGGMMLPDMPGLVHGIKGVEPYVLQCDGCLAVFLQGDIPLVSFLHTVRFHHPERGQFNRRMCAECWGAEGVKTMGTGRVS